MTARSSFIYQPPLYIIVTSTWQERHSDKKNGQIWLVRCNWETMVQFMEAAKRAIATVGSHNITPIAACYLCAVFSTIH